jgi:FkbM family methyltransferase
MQRFTWLLRRFFSDRNSAIISDTEKKYKIYLNDGYWALLLHQGFKYEEEVGRILEKVISDNTTFFDCGANNGYWSVYVAAKIGSPEHVIAVEPTGLPFDRLLENARLNGNSFRPIKKAVYSQSGLVLRFMTHPQRHAGNSCMDKRGKGQDGAYQIEYIASVTIDDLFRELLGNFQDTGDVVVKLDVEGAEIEALKGARDLIRGGALFIYEEHGQDLACRVTDFMLSELGLAVYFLGPNSWPIKVERLSRLVELKKTESRGYNLMAAREDSSILRRVLYEICEPPRFSLEVRSRRSPDTVSPLLPRNCTDSKLATDTGSKSGGLTTSGASEGHADAEDRNDKLG